jgi:predicted phage baseplate assembly protein
MKPCCDCCSGPGILTPLPTANQRGLAALAYRVGTWSAFLQTMQARLSSQDYPELAGLATRDPSDPSIALLDAWAVLGDVLAFYQERIANEGYLRTATERRSVLELARLIGYELRPGVSASVFLAFTIDKSAAPVTIPAGTAANSVPGPGEQMQTFETSDPLQARAAWNTLKPRQSRPQTKEVIASTGRLFLQGTSTRLQPNDPLVIDFGVGTRFIRIKSVQADADNKRTIVELPDGAMAAAEPGMGSGSGQPVQATGTDTKGRHKGPALSSLVDALKQPPSVPPASPARLSRSVADSFAPGADAFPRLLAAVEPRLQESLYSALAGLPAPPVRVSVYALRVSAAPFGHNAPLRLTGVGPNNKPQFGEWQIDDPFNSGGDGYDYGGGNGIGLMLLTGAAEAELPDHHTPSVLFLDNEYDIAAASRIVIDNPALDGPLVIDQAKQVRHRSLAAYGLTGKTVQLTLPDGVFWLTDGYQPAPFSAVRSTRVFAGSEALTLAEAPVTEDVSGSVIELDDVYPDLEPGRWLIVAGARTDVRDAAGKGVPGINTAELVMLATVRQATTGTTGDASRTVITLAQPLSYAYQRDTVTIHANVTHATHGQTRHEVLGSGDAAQAMQQFTLKQPPLTYVSAATPAGAVSTLQVRVNDLLWQEAAGMSGLGPNDRKYTTRAADDATTTVVFGNGTYGARLPTGQNNVRADYRNGIGVAGNANTGQISLLASKPLGVTGVVNPLPASGGADKDGPDTGRRNAPVAVVALDRLVSVQDYADFSRTFAGVGKAAAVWLTDGRRQIVHVTIAGAEDITIDVTSDLFRNLDSALHAYGDPYLPLTLAVRERLVVILSMKIKVQAYYLWELVETAVRTALLGAFGFDQVELAEDLLLSHVIAVVQQVPGVDSAEAEVFDTISEQDLIAGFSRQAASRLVRKDRIPVQPARPGQQQDVLPAQIAYLTSDVTATLILQEWTA